MVPQFLSFLCSRLSYILDFTGEQIRKNLSKRAAPGASCANADPKVKSRPSRRYTGRWTPLTGYIDEVLVNAGELES